MNCDNIIFTEDMMNDYLNNVLFIRVSHYNDFQFENIRASGYNIEEPYFGNNILLRIIRRIWFTYNLPYKDHWFNKRITNYNIETIIVFDVLITQDFLKWLIKMYPDCRILFIYGNLVGYASHIHPKDIPRDSVELWSFDKGDCIKYDMQNFYGGVYFQSMFVEKEEPKYDVLFIGKDKGRAEYLLWLENELNKQGLRTYFHIVADRKHKRFLKLYYKDMIKYNEIRELLSKSKAVLNIVVGDQTGITIRNMEAMFNGIKLITNNKAIEDCNFYSSSNVFVLEEDNVAEIAEFLSKPMESIRKDILDEYLFEAWLRRLLEVKKNGL